MATIKGTSIKISITGRMTRDLQVIDNNKYRADICVTDSIRQGDSYVEVPIFFSAFFSQNLLTEKQAEIYKQGCMISVYGDYSDNLYKGDSNTIINRTISAKDVEWKFGKREEPQAEEPQKPTKKK